MWEIEEIQVELKIKIKYILDKFDNKINDSGAKTLVQ